MKGILACPACGGSDIRRSHRLMHERLLTVITLLRPFRCEKCDQRFFRPFWFTNKKPEQ
jgi:predicted RNA-binding Zn-ribbon protein involved in translation (DUF1610 family)